MKILIVDDEKLIISVLKKVLEKAGHDVTVAGNGLEALSLIQSQDAPFAIALIDMLMPEMNGGEVLDAAKELNISTKFVLMTAYGDQTTHNELLNKGATQVIQKPFTDIMAIPALLEKLARA